MPENAIIQRSVRPAGASTKKKEAMITTIVAPLLLALELPGPSARLRPV